MDMQRLSIPQVDYIIKDIIFCEHTTAQFVQIDILEGYISLSFNDSLYKENSFDFNNPSLTNEEMKTLFSIADSILNKTDVKTDYTTFPFLKVIHFFINEFYLDEFFPKDKHKRISSSAVLSQFEFILQIPIVDVLKREFCNILKISSKINTKIYFTCDFDIVNIWDVYSFKDFAKGMVKDLFTIRIRKAFEYASSFFSSRKSNKYNYYLNEKMFVYENKWGNWSIENIGFWISQPSDDFYDCVTNYNDNPVKEYIEQINKKKVLFGIHPNYYTIDNPISINNQIIKFEELFNTKPFLARMHYLRYEYPETLELLEKNNIQYDYGFCFFNNLLFRGGISSPFKRWDFHLGRSINIINVPLTVMDGTLSDYLKLDFEQALIMSKNKIELVINYGNSLNLLWHNRSTYKFGTNHNYLHILFEKIKQYTKDIATGV